MQQTAPSPAPRFSGGTPGVRLDKDRFVAIGHAVGDLSCFHRKQNGTLTEAPDWTGRGSRREALPAGGDGGRGGRRPGGGKRGHRRMPSEAATATASGQQQGSGDIDLVEHPCDSSHPAPEGAYAWWLHHFPNGGHKLPHHHFSWQVTVTKGGHP